MKKKKRILAIVLVAALVLLVAAPVSATPKLKGGKLTLRVGESCQLGVRGISGKVKWSSSNKKVVKVTKTGVVIAKKKGKATITAKVKGHRIKCRVTVKKRKK